MPKLEILNIEMMNFRVFTLTIIYFYVFYLLQKFWVHRLKLNYQIKREKEKGKKFIHIA